MTIVAAQQPARCAPTGAPATRLDIALLGCGTVGSAFAALAATATAPAIRITHALVRDVFRPRPTLAAATSRTSHGADILAARPDVLVELLGGIEPARTLVQDALVRGIPVVTANKSLLAAHGAELREIAAHTATPLLFEAAVIAGVPFLGTFARRREAARLTRLFGIANGTSNYILTRARDARCGIEAPLADAQRLGYAEPDPASDVDGFDAAEKLVVLLQELAGLNVRRDALERTGIRGIDAHAIDNAAALGGTIKPLIAADWSDGLHAWVGPAFVPAAHVLAPVDGVENAIELTGPRGRLVFRGPGAGPEVTAATVLDDVCDAARGEMPAEHRELRDASPQSPVTPWSIAVSAVRLPSGADLTDLLAAHGVYLRRTALLRGDTFAALTWPCERGRIETALQSAARTIGGTSSWLRALECGDV